MFVVRCVGNMLKVGLMVVRLELLTPHFLIADADLDPFWPNEVNGRTRRQD
jgi:hypothetical protein